MALSVVAIKAAKSRDKAYKLSDSDGLYAIKLRRRLMPCPGTASIFETLPKLVRQHNRLVRRSPWRFR